MERYEGFGAMFLLQRLFLNWVGRLIHRRFERIFGNAPELCLDGIVVRFLANLSRQLFENKAQGQLRLVINMFEEQVAVGIGRDQAGAAETRATGHVARQRLEVGLPGNGAVGLIGGPSSLDDIQHLEIERLFERAYLNHFPSVATHRLVIILLL